MDSPILLIMVFEPMTIFLAFSDASDPGAGYADYDPNNANHPIIHLTIMPT